MNESRAVEEIFAPWEEPGSPGCAVAVLEGGEVVYERGHGLAEIATGRPIDAASTFDIASTAKQFTAVLALLLERDGVVSLDDELRRHLPEMPARGTSPTLRHLLQHTAGLRDLYELLGLAGLDLARQYPSSFLIEMMARQERSAAASGERFLYNDAGYFLLATALCRAADRSLEELAAERIFAPLGMGATRFYDPDEEPGAERAIGHMPGEDGSFVRLLAAVALPGAGALLTSAADLCRWARHCDEPGDTGWREILGAQHTPGRLADGTPLGYGLGVYLGAYRGLATVSHSGRWAGYTSELLRFPEQRWAVVVLSNLGTIDCEALARRVADVCLAGEFAGAGEGAAEDGAASESAADDAVPADAVPADAVLADAVPADAVPDDAVLGDGVLDDVAGEYYSPELDAAHSLVPVPGGLALALRGSPMQVPLEFLGGDAFTGMGAQLVLGRDAGGRVDRFTVSFRSIDGLVFRRRS